MSFKGESEGPAMMCSEILKIRNTLQSILYFILKMEKAAIATGSMSAVSPAHLTERLQKG